MKLYTVVFHPTNKPIVPLDANPNSDDEGFLVYRSRDAAEAAAEHQSDLYDLDCRACLLKSADLSLDSEDEE